MNPTSEPNSNSVSTTSSTSSPAVAGEKVDRHVIEVKTIDGRSSTGSFDVHSLSQGSRLLNGFKWLGISWAIAIGFVLVPIIHFVACPAFFLLGIYGFVRGFGIDKRFVGGSVACPACHEAIDMNARRVETTFREVCPKCANQLYFTVK